MQEAHMRRIEESLEALQPVAVNDPAAGRDVILRQARKLEIGKPRRVRLLFTEINPHQPARFVGRMTAHGDARGEALAPGAQLGRSVNALAIDRELPAV